MGLPGDFGFEPLRLHPKDGTDQQGMQLAKNKHGQFSMMAILVFANQ
jgi:Chlorophyll A-B binding protein